MNDPRGHGVVTIGNDYERDDSLLVELARSGDARAFGDLVRRYEKPLYNYLARMLHNGTEAEDVFQETFLKVHQNLDTFREGAPFRPWLYRIATNCCRDRQRYWKRRPQVALETPLGSEEKSGTLGDMLADDGPSPADQARERETADRLAAAVAQLPVKHRAVFLMARYDGLPYDEIGAALKIPVGTVKSRMNKAVKLLMEALDETEP
jgi:RNA polymerase sigma-70 factor (ECF subfamily)